MKSVTCGMHFNGVTGLPVFSVYLPKVLKIRTDQ